MTASNQLGISLKKIDALETDFLSPLMKNYIKGDHVLYDMMGQSDSTSWLKNNNYSKEARENLVNVLLKQYETINVGELVKDNILKLKDSKTFTVCTGQQIHIFLGPAFVMYKIWSCLDRCSALKKKHPEYNFVPLFWMATEDHDFEEINKVKLYGKSYEWGNEENGPVGRLNPKELVPLGKEIKTRIDDTAPNHEFLDLCINSYSKYSTFADATLNILNSLFGEEGLIVLNPDNINLKKQAINLIKADILEGELTPIIKEQIGVMKLEKIKAPINSRRINHFYINNGIRVRIIKTDGGYQTLDDKISWSSNEMKDAIEKTPECFSQNALLRPVYQQFILPNIAYIGGGGELKYWLELKMLFKYFNLPIPIYYLRSSCYITSAKTISKIIGQTPNFKWNWLLADDSEFTRKLLLESDAETTAFVSKINDLRTMYNALLKHIGDNDNTNIKISKLAKGVIDRNKKALSVLDEKYLAHKASGTEQIDKQLLWKNKVFSSDIQERTTSIISLLEPFETIRRYKLWSQQFEMSEKINLYITIK